MAETKYQGESYPKSMESGSEAHMFIQQMFIEYFLYARYNDRH